jgi:outer membrane immunogenic protein
VAALSQLAAKLRDHRHMPGTSIKPPPIRLTQTRRESHRLGLEMTKIWLAAAFTLLGSVSALAADLPARTYTKAPAMVAAAYDWTGWYIGVNGGGAWSDGRTGAFGSTSDVSYYSSALRDGYLPANYGAKHEGGFGGAQLGYNMQSGSWLFGIEADIQGADIGRTTNMSFPGGGTSVPSVSEARDHIDWFGTVRGRAGVTVDRVLFYGTGGLAYGGVRSSFRTSDLAGIEPTFGSSSGTRVGWAAGAGIEWAFAANWTVKAEYLHVDLGSTDVTGASLTSPTSLITYRYDHTFDAARVGINYRFGGPIIAKY